MKYYIIVGEASGDLHASRLMRYITHYDPEAQFRFIGGDNMSTVGGTRIRHYKELAYMGFIPVLLHLPTILSNMSMCKQDIARWRPDVVILVDYPGFNLKIAKYVKKQLSPKVFYYISPKIWAWKEWRIRSIKRDVDEMFSILPFEIDFFEKKHHYPIHYVGNPTAEEVSAFRQSYHESFSDFCDNNQLEQRPIIALLAGSRRQEIKDNLPAMIEASKQFADYQLVLAGAPSIDDAYYRQFLSGTRVHMVKDKTYQLLTHSTVALVTSDTATLETALFNVPQVVCYKASPPKLARFAFNLILKVKYISLVNLIAGREVVQEMFADRFRVYDIANELYRILPGQPGRELMLQGYQEVVRRLGNLVAPDNAARLMVQKLTALKNPS